MGANPRAFPAEVAPTLPILGVNVGVNGIPLSLLARGQPRIGNVAGSAPALGSGFVGALAYLRYWLDRLIEALDQKWRLLAATEKRLASEDPNQTNQPVQDARYVLLEWMDMIAKATEILKGDRDPDRFHHVTITRASFDSMMRAMRDFVGRRWSSMYSQPIDAQPLAVSLMNPWDFTHGDREGVQNFLERFLAQVMQEFESQDEAVREWDALRWAFEFKF